MNHTGSAAAALSGVLVAALSGNAPAADDYPTRPIRVVVPYAAGGADLYIRPIQQRIEKALGQPLVIENVGGAGGIVGATQVRNAPTDGHTILFAGIEDGKPQLWHMDPSGTYIRYDAKAIGSGSEGAQQNLQVKSKS